MADRTHVYHLDLPGFDPRQVLHDRCRECERRASLGLDVFRYLDDGNLSKLLGLADEVHCTGAYPEWTSACDRRVCELILRLSELQRQIGRAAGHAWEGGLRSLDGTRIERRREADRLEAIQRDDPTLREADGA